MSENLEFLITKVGLSPSEAWEILLLCLISANQTEGVIYNYSNVIPEQSGIAPDILALIPLDGSLMQNCNQGTMPVTWLQAWVQFWEYVGQVLFAVLIAIGLALLLPFLLLVAIGFAIWQAFTNNPVLMAIIEAIIKAIILILAVILLVFALFALGLAFLVQLIIFSLLPVQLVVSGLSFSLINGSNRQDIITEIIWEYVPLVDLYLPFIRRTVILNSEIISIDKDPIFLGESQTISQEVAPSEGAEQQSAGIKLQNAQDNPFLNPNEALRLFNIVFISYALMMGIISTLLGIYTFFAQAEHTKKMVLFVFLGALAGIVGIGMTINALIGVGEDSADTVYGFMGAMLALMIAGMILEGVMGISPSGKILSLFVKGAGVAIIFAVLRLLLTCIGGLLNMSFSDDFIIILVSRLIIPTGTFFITSLLSANALRAQNDARTALQGFGESMKQVGIILILISGFVVATKLAIEFINATFFITLSLLLGMLV